MRRRGKDDKKAVAVPVRAEPIPAATATVSCPTCGAANPPGSRFCAECGQALRGSAGLASPQGRTPTVYAAPQQHPPGYQPQPPQVHYVMAPPANVPVQQNVVVHTTKGRGCFGTLFQGVGFVVVAIIVILILIAIF